MNHPGIFESLETIVSTHKTELEGLDTEVARRPLSRDFLSKMKDIRISPVFMRSIFLHSRQRHINLILKNKCNLYPLLDMGLLRSSAGSVEYLRIEYTTPGDAREEGLADLDDVLDLLGRNHCENIIKKEKLVSVRSVIDRINRTKFNIPSTPDECRSTFQAWLSDPITPYLCQAPEYIELQKSYQTRIFSPIGEGKQRQLRKEIINSRARLYKTKILKEKLGFLQNTCLNLDAAESYCANYSTTDYWRQTIIGTAPKEHFSHLCSRILKKPLPLDDKSLKLCRLKTTESKDICEYSSTPTTPELFPKASCSELEKGLINSRLKMNYSECVGKLDNEAITHAHRIARHFDKEIPITDCLHSPIYNFYLLNKKGIRNYEWPMQICFTDPVKEEEICREYIPGNSDEIDISEDEIILQAVKRLTSADNNLKCKFIERSEYRPKLLKYKRGCFILYDPAKCTSLRCPKVIVNDEKIIDQIKYKGEFEFNFYPSKYTNRQYSTSYLLNEKYKLDSKNLRNRTQLNLFLKQEKKGIVEGMGCLEDILPSQFIRRSMNQCQPQPFIISGIAQEENEYHYVVHLSIQDVHFPYLIAWNKLFSAVKNYSNIHPLKTWTLNGLKKL